MAVHHQWYWPQLDQAAQRHLSWLILRYPAEDSMAWYQAQGYPVKTRLDIFGLPATAVEERASRLRQRWRRWLWGESAATLVLGPFAWLAGLTVISAVALAWAIEMGWSYGLDMDDAENRMVLRRLIHESLLPAVGIPPGRRAPLSDWRKLLQSAALWGFGPEFEVADRVMAVVRREFRREWGAVHDRSPAVHRNSLAIHGDHRAGSGAGR